MNKINIKFSNIVGILLTICVISIILYPWSKQNIEKFADSAPAAQSIPAAKPTAPTAPAAQSIPASAAVAPSSYLKSSEQLKTIYDTILNNRLQANNYLNRIQLLRDELHEKGTVSIDDYKKLINDINDAFTKKSKDKDLKGALDIKKELNNHKIENINKKINNLN